MSLVSKSCVERWFSIDSWVYKAFAYWFKNPLWNKRVPQGFSLCPYFWMALGSIFFFKPVFVPVCLAFGCTVKTILKIGGQPIIWLDRKISKSFGINVDSSLYEKGKGIGIGLLVLLDIGLLSLAIWGIYCCVVRLATFGTIYATIALLTFLNAGLLIATGIYTTKNQYKKDRCHPEWYCLILFILSLVVLSVIFPSQMGSAVVASCKGLGVFFKTCGVGIWIGIKAVSWSLLFCLKWIAIGIGWFLLFAVLLTIGMIPIGLLGILALKMGAAYDGKQTTKINTENKVDKADWQYLIGLTYDRHSVLFRTVRKIFEIEDCYDYSADDYILIEREQSYVIKTALLNLLKETAGITKDLLQVTYSDFANIRDIVVKNMGTKMGSEKYGFQGIQLILEIIKDEKIGISQNAIDDLAKIREKVNGLTRNDIKVTRTIQRDYTKGVAFAKIEIKKRQAEVRAKTLHKRDQQDKRHEMCKSVTTPIASFFMFFVGIAKAIFVGFLHKGILRPIGKVIAFVARNSWTFIVYMWTVAKHKKHGACPYMIFTDPVEEARIAEEAEEAKAAKIKAEAEAAEAEEKARKDEDKFNKAWDEAEAEAQSKKAEE